MTDIDPEILHTWSSVEGILCGEYPCDAEGSDAKIKALYEQNYNVFIDLTHPDDGLTSYTQHLYRRLEVPVSYHSFPIVDGDIVTNDSYAEIAYFMKLHFIVGSKIYLHCWGGMGRTATVLACFLKTLDHDLKPEVAFGLIDANRKDTSKGHLPAPQNDRQINAVKSFYSYVENGFGKDHDG